MITTIADSTHASYRSAGLRQGFPLAACAAETQKLLAPLACWGQEP